MVSNHEMNTNQLESHDRNDTTLLQFINCRVLRQHRLIKDDLWVRNGRFINPEPVFFEEKALADIQYDCQNAIIAPGYIDLQINGLYIEGRKRKSTLKIDDEKTTLDYF